MNGRDLVIEFCKRRKSHNPKSDYVPLWARDAKLLLNVQEILGEAETLLRMEAYFEDRDDWLLATGWSVPIFISRINQYDPLIASTARALAEARRNRRYLEENPGKDRTGKSEPMELSELLKKISEHDKQ